MAQSATRRSGWIAVPFLLVVALAVGWSAFWYYTARTADNAMAAWIEREAAIGRIYACSSRSIGGYPFRVEARCEEPSVELRGDGAPVIIKAKHILAVAQIYQP